MKRLFRLKILALVLAGLAVFGLFFAWSALPWILQTQAEKFVAEKTGHHLTMDRPEFNPLKLRLHLSRLRLTRPDNEPLLSFRDLVVEISPSSVYRGYLVFNSIRLDGLEAAIVLLPNGQLNWSALMDALQSKEKAPSSKPAPPPKFVLHRFALVESSMAFTDKRVTPAFSTRIEPLNIALGEITTLPNKKGQYEIYARTAFGASVTWHGMTSLEPLAVTGNISIDEVDLARLSVFIKDKLPIPSPTGIAGVSADYRLVFSDGRLDLDLKHIKAKVVGLVLHGNGNSALVVGIKAIEAKEGRFNLIKKEFALGALEITDANLGLRSDKNNEKKALELGSFMVEDVRGNLSSREAAVGRIAIKEGRVRVARDANGGIDIVEASHAALPPSPSKQDKKTETVNSPVEPGWRYKVGKIELADFTVSFRDESVAPFADLALERVSVSLDGLSEDFKIPLPLKVSFKARGGGEFEAEGKIIPSEPSADFRIKLKELNLVPAGPYLASVVNLKLADGRLSTEGRVRYNPKDARYRGGFAIRNLRLTDAESGDLFMAWKSLGTRELNVSTQKLDLGEIVLSGLDTQLIVYKDKTLSLAKVLNHKASAGAAEPVAPPASSSTKTNPARPFAANISRFKIMDSETYFADYSLALPFGTRIHGLQGVVTGISTQPGGAPGLVELEGQVDEYGLARANGQIDFLNPKDLLDLKVVFRNVEMTRLTPYSATFAGRKITSGKLSLDLEYKIHQHQLQGENQVIMDQLVLGEKVDSPQAHHLPLDLAIAILEDSDGRIDLGLPVSGSLDDPQFSYGGIIWKAIVNVVTKIATAPFRALGALFGGGEKFESIVFEAGNPQLTPPEREKIVRLAGALTKRPKLSLEIHGVYAEKDRIVLRDRQLRRTLIEKSGQQVEEEGDPGPISLQQPDIQSALETLFEERFGGEELASLKEKETESTKEAEIYQIMFDRLRDATVVDDAGLLALAKARGEFTVSELQSAGVPTTRLALLEPEKVEGSGGEIPVKLVLGVAATSAAPESPPVAPEKNIPQ